MLCLRTILPLVHILYMHNSLSKFYYLPPTLFDRWQVTRRVWVSRWCSRRKSAPVRTESESMPRQLQMQQTDRVRFGSGILRPWGSHSSGYVAQGVLVSQRQLRPYLSPALIHGLEVVVLTGQQAVTVRERQLVRTVMQSQSHLRSCCWILGGYQGPE